jgi:hypothetical protein
MHALHLRRYFTSSSSSDTTNEFEVAAHREQHEDDVAPSEDVDVVHNLLDVVEWVRTFNTRAMKSSKRWNSGMKRTILRYK